MNLPKDLKLQAIAGHKAEPDIIKVIVEQKRMQSGKT